MIELVIFMQKINNSKDKPSIQLKNLHLQLKISESEEPKLLTDQSKEGTKRRLLLLVYTSLLTTISDALALGAVFVLPFRRGFAGDVAFVRGGSGAAGDRGREEGGLAVAGHDDDDALLAERRGLGSVATACWTVHFAVTAAAVVARFEVAGELPVGAGEDEEGEADETQHHRQRAEEVGNRRLPRRVRRARRGGGRRLGGGGATACVKLASGPH